MNARVLAIAVSMLLNVALVWSLWGPALAARNEGGRVEQKSTTPSTRASLLVETQNVGVIEKWSSLSSGSLAEVAARLNAQGFPLRLQRVILRGLVAQQFADRHREIADLTRAKPWWTSMYGSDEGAKLILARQRLVREENDAVAAVLGPDPGDSEYVKASQLYRYGSLPPATLHQLEQINQDYGELSGEIRNASQGFMLPVDREKLLYLEQERHEDIAELLTPDQLFEYELRNSPSGWWLRQQLVAMDPTPEEFRAMFKVQHGFMQSYSNGNFALMTAEQKASITSKTNQLTEQMRSVLTPERFAEYALKTTPEYLQTDALVKRLELPATATASILSVQKDIMARANVVRTYPKLPAADRAAQLGALADEAYVRLAATMGDNGVTAYRQNVGGWLRTLQPRSSTAPKL